MANETILRNGLIAKAASEVEGTLGVQGLQMLNSSNAVQYTFPTTDSTGNSGYALTTNGAGTLAFAAMPDISALLVNISSESIHDLNDVEAASGVATGDVLQWSGSTWAHVAATSIGVTTLEALTDTTITAAADGDFLRHNGSAWVDSAIQNSDITSGMVTQHDGDIEIAVSQVTDFDPSDYVTTTAGNTNYVLASAVGANSGVASLDASGLVPSTQLPSYVDDVIEFDQPLTTAGDPVVGDLPSGETETTGKIYVDTATNDVYRWSGSAFVNITDFATPDHNLTTHGDVTIASVGTGELLQYTGSEWENQTLDEVGLSIGNLSDVDITTAAPSNQQVLAWNDTDSEFQPTSVSSLSQSDAVSTLTDVTLSSLATGELLVSTGASSWANKTIAEAGLAAASHTHTASEITDFSAAAIIVADAQIAAADIQDLSNVTNVGTAGQVLQSTGTNATFVTLDHDDITDFDAEVDAIVDTVIAATDIADLSDVSGSASAGDVLVYSGSVWEPTAAALYERTSATPGSDAAADVITEALVGGYAAVTVEYSLKDGSANMRMGQLMVITDGSTVELTDISTASIGSEADEPVFSATTGANLVIKIADASGYTVKTAHFVVNA
jgi:hypothetical protein